MKKVIHGRPPPWVALLGDTTTATMRKAISARRCLLSKNNYKNIILEIMTLLYFLFCRWIEAAGAFSGNQISTGVQKVKSILREMEVKVSDQSRENEEDVKKSVVMNIQYVFKFLRELLAHSQETKMDIHNIGIVFGPNLLWQTNTANNSLPTSGGSMSNEPLFFHW